MHLPPLFKKTASGAMQEWAIEVQDCTIVTRWGQVGGAIQETRDLISEGKNTGKANATTACEQAICEAGSLWEKRLKKGYVKTVEEAEAGTVDEIIEGGIVPMLAFPFDKQGHKLKYPLYGNCKLDGTRCIAMVKNGKATLWSRTRKPITAMPHIVRALEKAFPTGEIAFDGELYAAHLNYDFEQIIHLVRQQEATAGHEAIQYWVYDMPTKGTFEERYKVLVEVLPEAPEFVLVEATLLNNEDQAMDYFANCQLQGFEGAILRNSAGLYVNKRSSDLIKLKTFLDAEFDIVGIEEGRGKLAGHVGAFVCRNEAGSEFKAKLKGSLDYLAVLFKDASLWEGKKLTVRYQNLTSDGIVRFPVGIAIRDYD